MRRAAQGDSQGVRHLFMQSEDDDYDEIKSRIERLRSVNIIIKDEVNDQVRELGSANSIFDSLEETTLVKVQKTEDELDQEETKALFTFFEKESI
ncbi:hypothetical protein QYM36_004369 [Artemia franciscana]|uniref:Uncharacterized protein n=1 Tax=Artemia franciscana TaxID=6661 RepID=A0AA88L6N6_ARTSF|nr:hypothetical protein QYM36_004369 [Artemia franciscana]